jgi:6-phosphogluconolactonase
MSDRPVISVAKDVERLSHLAAATISELIGRAIEARGVSYVALAGGATPLRVYQILGGDPVRDTIDWRHVHLFFGDERMVPPDDPASNYGMVSRELVSRVPIPLENIHRIRGEASGVDAGRAYETELQKCFGGHLPRFDIVLLGVGEDGHTASLFPGTDSLKEASRMAIGYFVPQLNSWRVTLTLPVLLNACETIFLVTGRRKASVVSRIVEAGEPQVDLPASMVRPSQGRVHWMLDEEAASMLSHTPGKPENLTGWNSEPGVGT